MNFLENSFEVLWIFYHGNYLHAWLVYSTWTDSRYVVVWEHFHLAIILWYTVALVDERWEIFFNIRALKETFYRCLLGYVIVKLKLESNTPMITLYIKAYWFIMRISTSDILRLKQPCTTIIEHVEKEKVTFDLFDLTGRITDACFEMCKFTYGKNIFVANINLGRSFLDLLSTDHQTGNKLAVSFLITFKLFFFWMNTKNVDNEFERHSSFDLWHNWIKGFLLNFPQSSLFWYYCIERLTLASAREPDDLKLEDWKHNYFL